MGFTGKIQSRSIIWAALTLAAAGMFSTLAESATAATVRSGSTLQYRAAKGETNRLWVYFNNGKYQFHEAVANVTAPAPCQEGRQWGQPVVECPAEGVRRIKIKLEDGDDQVVLSGAPPLRGYTVDGGRGNDRLFGSTPAPQPEGSRVTRAFFGDTLAGGLGDDTLVGNGGPDFLKGQTGDDRIWAVDDGSADLVICGSGVDQASGDVPSGANTLRDDLKQCEQPLASKPE